MTTTPVLLVYDQAYISEWRALIGRDVVVICSTQETEKSTFRDASHRKQPSEIRLSKRVRMWCSDVRPCLSTVVLYSETGCLPTAHYGSRAGREVLQFHDEWIVFASRMSSIRPHFFQQMKHVGKNPSRTLADSNRVISCSSMKFGANCDFTSNRQNNLTKNSIMN